MPGPIPIALTVNGIRHELAVEPRWLLVDVLRDTLGLTGTHVGCEHGVCGTCTVLVNGETVRSCLMLAASADGAEIMTVEGLSSGDGLHPAAGGLPRGAGAAVRLLHAGHAHDRLRAAAREPVAERGRDPRGHLRQPLPLHRLPGHRRGRRASPPRASGGRGRR